MLKAEPYGFMPCNLTAFILGFVLKEYVDIEMLKRSIIVLDSDAISYYQDNIVSFTASEKTKIQWTNSEGVFTNLANRI